MDGMTGGSPRIDRPGRRGGIGARPTPAPSPAPPVLAHVLSAAVLGIDAYMVGVEADVANGLPTFATVGLPQGAVREGKERVVAALQNSGYSVPPKRITVNLAPAGS